MPRHKKYRTHSNSRTKLLYYRMGTKILTQEVQNTLKFTHKAVERQNIDAE